MTKKWLTGAAAVALVVGGAFAAQAADLPTRKEAPAPVFVPPPFTWTGFYVGLNAGGIWATGNTTTTLYNAGFPLLQTDWPTGTFGNSDTGFIGGGQVGYNWQWGAMVLGAEADFDGTSLSHERTLIGPTFLFNGQNDWFALNGSTRLDWLGTVRGRIGFVATPDNRLMFYGTGGLAYGGGSGHLNLYDNTNGWGWFSGNRSDTRAGWTIGGGVEYAITNNVTIRGEYLYYNLGSTNAVTVPNLLAQTAFPAAYATAKINFEGSILRAGVNYKF